MSKQIKKTQSEEQTDTTNTTTINGVEYSLDSNPNPLLSILSTKKVKNEETGKWENLQINYIDVDYVRHLIDKLIGIKKLVIGDMTPTGREYYNEYYDKYKKQNIKKTFYEHKLTVDLVTMDDREFSVTKRGVFASGQLSSNDSLRGAQGQLEAIVLKSLAKYLGNIFRVKELLRIDEEEGVEVDYESDVTSTGESGQEKISSSSEGANKKEKQSSETKSEPELKTKTEQEFYNKIKSFRDEGKNKDELLNIARDFVTNNNIKQGSNEKKRLLEIFKSLTENYEQ